MSSEDQDILAKIGQLAGQINRHKNGQPAGHQANSVLDQSYRGRGGYSQRGAGWRGGRGAYPMRGYARGGRAQPYRNKTLVLNSNPDQTTSDDPESAAGTPTTPGWVTKKDRHLQLINTSIFEKESQNRVKAMEETRKQKLRQRDEREQAKFARKLERAVATSNTAQSVSINGTPEINVQGIMFRVMKNGSKLVKIPGDSNSAKATPKTAVVFGVRFYRSKNGNLFRSGIIKSQRRSGMVKKVNEPCKQFSTTGQCTRGPRCRYIHDPSKVAVCREFLQKESCPSGDSCDLSHDLTPERIPNCLHFAKGHCSKSRCHYSHVHVSPSAPVCRAFGIYGYCEKGLSCEERHVHECPDFSNTGTCATKGCTLPHRHKASVMRQQSEPPREDESDMSSDDEDDEIDSDDVDSDDLDDEYFGDAGVPNPGIRAQSDFVQFA